MNKKRNPEFVPQDLTARLKDHCVTQKNDKTRTSGADLKKRTTLDVVGSTEGKISFERYQR